MKSGDSSDSDIELDTLEDIRASLLQRIEDASQEFLKGHIRLFGTTYGYSHCADFTDKLNALSRKYLKDTSVLYCDYANKAALASKENSTVQPADCKQEEVKQPVQLPSFNSTEMEHEDLEGTENTILLDINCVRLQDQEEKCISDSHDLVKMEDNLPDTENQCFVEVLNSLDDKMDEPSMETPLPVVKVKIIGGSGATTFTVDPKIVEDEINSVNNREELTSENKETLSNDPQFINQVEMNIVDTTGHHSEVKSEAILEHNTDEQVENHNLTVDNPENGDLGQNRYDVSMELCHDNPSDNQGPVNIPTESVAVMQSGNDLTHVVNNIEVDEMQQEIGAPESHIEGVNQEPEYVEVINEEGLAFLIPAKSLENIGGLNYVNENGETVVFINSPNAMQEGSSTLLEVPQELSLVSDTVVTDTVDIQYNTLPMHMQTVAQPMSHSFALTSSQAIMQQSLTESDGFSHVVIKRTDSDKKSASKQDSKSLSALDKLNIVDKVMEYEQSLEENERSQSDSITTFPVNSKDIRQIGDLQFTVAPLRPQSTQTLHAKEILPPNQFQCAVCYECCKSEIKTQEHYFQEHIRKQDIFKDAVLSTNPGFSCQVCEIPFKYHTDFQEHLEDCEYKPENFGYSKPEPKDSSAQGINKLPFKCKFCKRCFKAKGYLTTHIVTNHLIFKPGAPNSCDLCKRRFLDAYSLKQHTKTAKHKQLFFDKNGHHEDEVDGDESGAHGYTNLVKTPKPYERKRGKLLDKTRLHICEQCGREFNRSSSLWLHVKTHEKAFVCNKCGLRFATKPKLLVHERIHTGDMPFFCGTCGKRFRSQDHVRHHEKAMHTDLVHKCNTCGNIFKHARNLDHHIKKKHGMAAMEELRQARARGELIVYEAGAEPF